MGGKKNIFKAKLFIDGVQMFISNMFMRQQA